MSVTVGRNLLLLVLAIFWTGVILALKAAGQHVVVEAALLLTQ